MKDKKGMNAQEMFTLVVRKGTMTVSHVSHSIRTSGRHGEKMHSLTNKNKFRRHGCPCEDL